MIWKRFILSLLGVDRCSLRWGSGKGLLEIYWGWTDAASAGHLEMFVGILAGVDRRSLSWVSGRGLLTVYWGWTDSASAGDQEEVY